MTEDDIETVTSKLFFHTYLSEFQTLKLFAGSASQHLAGEVAAHLDISLGRMRLLNFNDGETYVEVLDDVQGQKVYVIQSISPR
jgi:ribose-phosphate pyrophosphokinase